MTSFLLVLTSMTLNPQNGFLLIFVRFPSATHILRVKCAEMNGDGPGQTAYNIFSIERTFLGI